MKRAALAMGVGSLAAAFALAPLWADTILVAALLVGVSAVIARDNS